MDCIVGIHEVSSALQQQTSIPEAEAAAWFCVARGNRSMTNKILVVEDEESLAQLLQVGLQGEGYQVLSAKDGVEGLQLLWDRSPDLILLDVMMPRMNGWEACRRIREYSDVPIIMLTAMGTEPEKVRGLELGADDYLTKPFSMAELVARIRAALRRQAHPTTENGILRIDERLAIDRVQCQVIVEGERQELSATEYQILTCLLDNAGRIVTRQSLLTQVWGWEYVEETNYVKVYIHHLRQKIERDPKRPTYIITERGLGYRFQTGDGLTPP
jgi:DNA-binding response OmpR family regulator